MLSADGHKFRCYSLLNVVHGCCSLAYLAGQNYFGNAANDSLGEPTAGHSPATGRSPTELTDYRAVNHLILLTVCLELLILIKSVGFSNLIHFARPAGLARAVRFVQLLLLSIFIANLLTILLGATDLR